jgi:hypothetical protein
MSLRKAHNEFGVGQLMSSPTSKKKIEALGGGGGGAREHNAWPSEPHPRLAPLATPAVPAPPPSTLSLVLPSATLLHCSAPAGAPADLGSKPYNPTTLNRLGQ